MCFSQGRALLSKLQGLKARGVNLKISSGIIDSTELSALDKHCQLSLSLYYTFSVSVFKRAAAWLCLFILSPHLSRKILLISTSHSVFQFTCFISSRFSFCLLPDLPPRLYSYHLLFMPFDVSLLSFTHAPFLSRTPFPDAEVHYINMTALTKGHLLSSFWVVDRRHFYIGSASMDWRSLATVSTIHHTSQHTQKYTHMHNGT